MADTLAGRAAWIGLRARAANTTAQINSRTAVPRNTAGQPSCAATTGPANTASD
jgi:hypothetical protein